jgi:hypothetical protein
MKNVFVQVSIRHEGDVVSGEYVTVIEAIHRMQAAIAYLRQRSASNFDPSFGEQPPAVLAPSEEEIQQAQRAVIVVNL